MLSWIQRSVFECGLYVNVGVVIINHNLETASGSLGFSFLFCLGSVASLLIYNRQKDTSGPNTGLVLSWNAREERESRRGFGGDSLWKPIPLVKGQDTQS